MMEDSLCFPSTNLTLAQSSSGHNVPFSAPLTASRSLPVKVDNSLHIKFKAPDSSSAYHIAKQRAHPSSLREKLILKRKLLNAEDKADASKENTNHQYLSYLNSNGASKAGKGTAAMNASCSHDDNNQNQQGGRGKGYADSPERRENKSPRKQQTIAKINKLLDRLNQLDDSTAGIEMIHDQIDMKVEATLSTFSNIDGREEGGNGNAITPPRGKGKGKDPSSGIKKSENNRNLKNQAMNVQRQALVPYMDRSGARGITRPDRRVPELRSFRPASVDIAVARAKMRIASTLKKALLVERRGILKKQIQRQVKGLKAGSGSEGGPHRSSVSESERRKERRSIGDNKSANKQRSNKGKLIESNSKGRSKSKSKALKGAREEREAEDDMGSRDNRIVKRNRKLSEKINHGNIVMSDKHTDRSSRDGRGSTRSGNSKARSSKLAVSKKLPVSGKESAGPSSRRGGSMKSMNGGKRADGTSTNSEGGRNKETNKRPAAAPTAVPVTATGTDDGEDDKMVTKIKKRNMSTKRVAAAAEKERDGGMGAIVASHHRSDSHRSDGPTSRGKDKAKGGEAVIFIPQPSAMSPGKGSSNPGEDVVDPSPYSKDGGGINESIDMTEEEESLDLCPVCFNKFEDHSEQQLDACIQKQEELEASGDGNTHTDSVTTDAETYGRGDDLPALPTISRSYSKGHDILLPTASQGTTSNAAAIDFSTLGNDEMGVDEELDESLENCPVCSKRLEDHEEEELDLCISQQEAIESKIKAEMNF